MDKLLILFATLIKNTNIKDEKEIYDLTLDFAGDLVGEAVAQAAKITNDENLVKELEEKLQTTEAEPEAKVKMADEVLKALSEADKAKAINNAINIVLVDTIYHLGSSGKLSINGLSDFVADYKKALAELDKE